MYMYNSKFLCDKQYDAKNLVHDIVLYQPHNNIIIMSLKRVHCEVLKTELILIPG